MQKSDLGVERKSERGRSLIGDSLSGTLKGILKTGGGKKLVGEGGVKLPRVTFKIEGVRERARETPID